jgi:hypothetical protein
VPFGILVEARFMSILTVGLVFFASVLMVFFAYIMLTVIAKSNEYLAEWAKRNDYRIISYRYVLIFRRGWYFIVVEDRSGKRRSGRITFGLFSGKEDVYWDM